MGRIRKLSRRHDRNVGCRAHLARAIPQCRRRGAIASNVLDRGLFGAIYIAISILLLPRLGAATVIALIVAGQMTGSLAFDHFGLFGLPVHPVTAPRGAGALRLLVGAILVRY